MRKFNFSKHIWATTLALLVIHAPSFAVECSDEVRIVGEITSLSPGTGEVGVDGTLYAADEDTRIRGNGGEDLDLNGFSVGELVEIEFCPTSGPPPILIQIKKEDSPGVEVEFKGTIESIDSIAGSLIVDGTQVLTTLATTYLDHQNLPIIFEDFSVGDYVEVGGLRQPNLSVVATKLKQEDLPGAESRFKGTVESIDALARSLVVDGTLVTTATGTIFLDHENLPISFEDFAQGDYVEVEGTRQIDNSIRAAKVKKEDLPGSEAEFKGTVESIDALARSLVVDGTLVTTVTGTIFLDHENLPISFEDFAQGDYVEVEGTRQIDNSIRAAKVKKEDLPGSETEFKGTVESIDALPRSLVVDGTLVTTVTGTIFLDHENLPISFEDFAQGDYVEVEGTRQIDNSIRAAKVKKEDLPGSETEFKGTVESIDALARSLVVDGTLVTTVTGTVFLDHENLPISFEDFAEGDYVEVEGTRQIDNSIRAAKVKKEDFEDDECEEEFKGAIVEIDPAELTMLVGLVRIRTNETTSFGDHEDNPITFEDFSIGDFVEVKYCSISGAPPLASEVRMEDGEDDSPEAEVKVEGVASEVFPGSNTLIVEGVVIHTENARIRNDNDQAITLADLIPGDFLEVEGLLLGDGTVDAKSIKKEDGEDGGCGGKVRGNLNILNASTRHITVGLIEILVGPNTQIRDDETNQSLVFDDLVLGQALKVEFCSSTGVPVASEIEVKSPSNYDLNDDGRVGGDDLVEFHDSHQRGGLNVDLNGDNRTGSDDLFLMSGQWEDPLP